MKNEVSVRGNGNDNANGMLDALDRRIDQRFTDLKSGYEQRFGDIGNANVIALAAQKEALKTASDNTDKALIKADESVKAALVIERTSTKEKFDTLNQSSQRQEALLNSMIPRGEVTEKIEGVSERVKKMEDFVAGQISSANTKKDTSAWTVSVVMSIVALAGVLMASISFFGK